MPERLACHRLLVLSMGHLSPRTLYSDKKLPLRGSRNKDVSWFFEARPTGPIPDDLRDICELADSHGFGYVLLATHAKMTDEIPIRNRFFHRYSERSESLKCNTRRILVISTAHVNPATFYSINPWPIPGSRREASLWLIEPTPTGTIPEDLLRVCEYANTNGCDFVLLDHRAEIVGDLLVYPQAPTRPSKPHESSSNTPF